MFRESKLFCAALAMFLASTAVLFAQRVEVEFSMKLGPENMLVTYNIYEHDGQSYTLELWGKPVDGKELMRIDYRDETMGPGLSSSTRNPVSGELLVPVSTIPEEWGTEVELMLRAIPDSEGIPSDLIPLTLPGGAPSWIGENLSSSSYYTFGFMDMNGSGQSNFTMEFMITNIGRSPRTIRFQEDCLGLNIINRYGNQQRLTTDTVYVGGSRLYNDYVEVAAGETIEGYFRFSQNSEFVREIENGSLILWLEIPSTSQTVRIGPGVVQ